MRRQPPECSNTSIQTNQKRCTGEAPREAIATHVKRRHYANGPSHKTTIYSQFFKELFWPLGTSLDPF